MCRSRSVTRGRCGAPTSPPGGGPSATTPMRGRRTRRCSRVGTRPRWLAAFSSRRRRSRPVLSRARTPRRTSTSPSRSWMRRWAKQLASLVVLATAACPRRSPGPQPAGGELELRIGLAVGLANASIGGPEGGELFVSEAASGLAVGSVPVGVRWVVLPDSADPSRLRLVRPDSTRTEALRGIAVVNVTESRFVVANGRRYRGRINITSSRAGLTVVNRVTVESYIAGVVGPEGGARRPDGMARADLGPDDARDIALDGDAIHHRQAGSARRDVDPTTVAPAVRHHEAALGDVDDGDAAQRLGARAIRSHQAQSRRVGGIGQH